MAAISGPAQTVKKARLLENDTHSFIVRIWSEEDQEARPGHRKIWRGSIEHVGQDKRLYFYDLNGILRFIREQASIETRTQPLEWLKTWIEKLRAELSLSRK